MKFEFNRKYTTIAIYAFLVLAAAILFHNFLGNFYLFKSFSKQMVGIMMPFIYAFGLAYILNPILKFVERFCLDRLCKGRLPDRPKRAIAILLTYLFAAGLMTVFFLIVVPQLIISISELIIKAPGYFDRLSTLWETFLDSYFPDFDLPAAITRYLEQYTEQLTQTLLDMLTQFVPWVVGLSTRFASGMISILVGVIVSIYMLFDKERFFAGSKKACYAFLSSEKADWLLELTGDANRIFGGFISGKLLDSLIIGILCFILMSNPWANMPNAVLVSVIVGVTNVIPYFGPFIGAIPSFFIILIDDPVKAIWFLLLIFLIQQFDGNILGPKILGDSTGLSAFWVVFSIMLFGNLYGFIGMFLGVPVFSVILMLLRRLVDRRLDAQHMPVEMESYCAPEAQLLRRSSGKKRSSDLAYEQFKTKTAHTVKPIKSKESKAEDTEEK